MVEKSVGRISINLLPNHPELTTNTREKLREDFEKFAAAGLPDPLEPYLEATYGIDVASTYAGIPIRNPWGKASGQLSMTELQVEEDAAAGLGFCVLKTVIAEDQTGEQSMRAWAIPESRMLLEQIRGANGNEGWTVSWKGRGWSRSLGDYLKLVRSARRIGDKAGMLVVPSCKFHLPTADDPGWRTSEYEFTTSQIIKAYTASASTGNPQCTNPSLPLPLEKDFSPTLAGSGLAKEKRQILDWLRTVPRLIRLAAGDRPVRVGLKLFNALFDDQFQLEMLQTIVTAGPDRPDFAVMANRLFDPHRIFQGQRGIAVGGPDLSARNLQVLSDFQGWIHRRDLGGASLELSGTGNICSGKMAVEYLVRGCSSFQLHTFFQLPASEYRMRQGSKISKALHLLYFDPDSGLIAWLLHVARRLGLLGSSTVRLRDLVGAAQRL